MFEKPNQPTSIVLDPPRCRRHSSVATCRCQALLAAVAFNDVLDASPESVRLVKRGMARRIDHLLSYHAGDLHPDAVRLLCRSAFALHDEASGMPQRWLRRYVLRLRYYFRGTTVRGGCEIPWDRVAR